MKTNAEQPSVSDWYYMHNGKKIGPVNAAQFQALLRANSITQHTLVWRNEFGNKWKELQATDLWTGRRRPYLTKAQQAELKAVSMKPTTRALRSAAIIGIVAVFLFIVGDINSSDGKDISIGTVVMIWLVVSAISYKSQLKNETADQTWHRRRKEEILGESIDGNRSDDGIR
jgi:hypothetical protein